MEFKDLVQMRRSHRKFTEQEIDGDDVKTILRAGLMSPTSKGQRSWQFVVVDDKTDLEKLSDAKDLGGQFLKGAALAIVVLGDPLQNDCWVEDGSIAAISMQYQAERLHGTTIYCHDVMAHLMEGNGKIGGEASCANQYDLHQNLLRCTFSHFSRSSF